MAGKSAPADLGKVSDDRLRTLWETAADDALAARVEAKRLGDEVEARQVKAEAERKLAQMSDAERAALGLPAHQAAQPVGIESEEGVGADG